MKINVDVDLTPEELRRLIGLPDVASFQEELMTEMRNKMKAGIEGYDPLSLYQPFLNNAFASMTTLQQIITKAMTTSTSTKEK